VIAPHVAARGKIGFMLDGINGPVARGSGILQTRI
jgi:hypothetical protein